jgi:hypothetical protein
MCQQGFSHGYKVVNTWLREYLGKPRRRSSEQEKATYQAFLATVAPEQDLISSLEETATQDPPPAESTGIPIEPLGSPWHLSWQLLRDPASLDEQEYQVPAFIREVRDIDITYQ